MTEKKNYNYRTVCVVHFDQNLTYACVRRYKIRRSHSRTAILTANQNVNKLSWSHDFSVVFFCELNKSRANNIIFIWGRKRGDRSVAARRKTSFALNIICILKSICVLCKHIYTIQHIRGNNIDTFTICK